MAESQQEAESMPACPHPSVPCGPSRFPLIRAALGASALAAACSCAGNGGAAPPRTAFDASAPPPAIGAVDSAPAASSPPADLDSLPDDPSRFIDLDQYTRDRLALQKRQREKAEQARSGGLDAAVETERSADSAIESGRSAQAPAMRPAVIWLPPAAPPSTEPQAYDGPTGAGDPASAAAHDDSKQAAPAPEFAAAPVVRLADLITPFKSQLAMQAADSPSPLREHLITASLLMLEGQKRIDPETLYDLTDREREVLKAYQDHFVRLGGALAAGGGAEAVVKDAADLVAGLNAEKALRIGDFRLCKRIMNYGLYEEVETYKFAALRPTPLLTYVEIEGFKSVPGGDGKYITRVRHELELYTERDGELVYAWPSAPAEDVCGKVRRDFFLPRQIQLPSNLTMGRYRLKVRIIDEQSQHQAESVIALSIVAGGDVALNP